MSDSIFNYFIEKTQNGRDSGDGEEGAVITSLKRSRRFLEVPGELGGVPVRRIAPHAFSGQEELRGLSLPGSLRSVGAFAFSKCPQLEEISLHDGIRDFYNGVLRQDIRLRQFHFFVHEGNFTVMRDILSETDSGLRFRIRLPEGEAQLFFPGYDYSFAENTMARTIQFSITGTGVMYRECVRRKGIGWREYDCLFPRVVPDDPAAAAEIAVLRLLYPYSLAASHAADYEEYLRTHAADVLSQFVRELAAGSRFLGNMDGGGRDDGLARLRLMADRGMITAGAAEQALQIASRAGLTEICGIILAGRESVSAGKRVKKPAVPIDAFSSGHGSASEVRGVSEPADSSAAFSAGWESVSAPAKETAFSGEAEFTLEDW